MFTNFIYVDPNMNFKFSESLNYYVFEGVLGISKVLKHSSISVLNNEKLSKGSIYKIELKSNSKKFLNLYFKIFKNNIKGVVCGYISKLNIIGVGYTALVLDGRLFLNLGFSHQLIVKIPEGIKIKIKKKKFLTFIGSNLVDLTCFVSLIRSKKVPDIYKGKGFLYDKEKIILKVGKKA